MGATTKGLDEAVASFNMDVVFLPYAEGGITKADLEAIIGDLKISYAPMEEWAVYEHPVLWRKRYKHGQAKNAIHRMRYRSNQN